MSPIETRKALKQGGLNRSKLQVNPQIPQELAGKGNRRPTVTEWHKQQLEEAMDQFQADTEIDLTGLDIPEFTPAEVKDVEGMIERIADHNRSTFRQNADLKDNFEDWKISKLRDTINDNIQQLGIARTNEFGVIYHLGVRIRILQLKT